MKLLALGFDSGLVSAQQTLGWGALRIVDWTHVYFPSVAVEMAKKFIGWNVHEHFTFVMGRLRN